LETPVLEQEFICQVPFNEVYVWGSNKHGQLGTGITEADEDHEAPREQNGINEALLPKICCFNTVIKKVSCGISHTLLLSATGHVYSMGGNQYGQLGLNEPYHERDSAGNKVVLNRLLPCLVESLQDYIISDIAAGNDHSLAMTECGDSVFTWGLGKFGALGNSKS